MATVLHYVSAEETGSGTAISGTLNGTITAATFAICARPLPNQMLRSSLPKMVYNNDDIHLQVYLVNMYLLNMFQNLNIYIYKININICIYIYRF